MQNKIVLSGKDTFYSLIKPEPDYYNYWCQRVHGLCSRDTDNAPVFPDVWAKIEPMIEGLKFFWPKLNKGGYIFVHDFDSWAWPGVKKAVYEFLDKENATMIPICDCYSSVILSK